MWLQITPICINASISRTCSFDIQDHTTHVASIAASFDSTYRRMAYGATVLSVGHEDVPTDVVDGLQWAINHGARIVNMSEGFSADNWMDRAFDYWARLNSRLIVKSAGNTGITSQRQAKLGMSSLWGLPKTTTILIGLMTGCAPALPMLTQLAQIMTARNRRLSLSVRA